MVKALRPGETGGTQGADNLFRCICPHPVNDFREFCARGVRAVRLIADQETPAAFQDVVNLRKTLFQPRPEIDCFKGGDQIEAARGQMPYLWQPQ